ncbi:hypothetical protein [Blastococcus sp. KM273128]|uniref:hypothetical protein n=1 Tax=Blastococcus sp. KM273128 TaxID=2570314 RepID=UPI0035AB72BD
MLVAEVFADVGEAAEPASCRRAHLGHVLTVGQTPCQSRRRAAAALDAIRVDVDEEGRRPVADRGGADPHRS